MCTILVMCIVEHESLETGPPYSATKNADVRSWQVPIFLSRSVILYSAFMTISQPVAKIDSIERVGKLPHMVLIAGLLRLFIFQLDDLLNFGLVSRRFLFQEL